MTEQQTDSNDDEPTSPPSPSPPTILSPPQHDENSYPLNFKGFRDFLTIVSVAASVALWSTIIAGSLTLTFLSGGIAGAVTFVALALVCHRASSHPAFSACFGKVWDGIRRGACGCPTEFNPAARPES